MFALLLCLLALGAAPAVDRGLHGRPRLESFADGLVQVVVGGILLVHILPFGLATAGWPAAVALGGGALLGALIHRMPRGRGPVEGLAIAALLLHALVDGAALASSDHGALELLGEAVVLHTLPVGLATWRISRARLGVGGAVGLLAATGLATTLGWHATGQAVVAARPAAIALVQCAVAGALLHVLGHLGEGGRPRASGLGALAGAGMVVALGLSHDLPDPQLDELDAGALFVEVGLASAPWLLGGYLLSGLLRAAGLGGAGGAGLPGVVRGALRGLWAPVSSCEAPAAAEEMVEHGASPPGALAYLAAAPGLAVATLGVSAPLLGLQGLLVRALGALTVGLTVGLTAAPRATLGPAHAHRHEHGASAFRAGLTDAIEHTAPWVLAGLWVAALAEPLLPANALAGIAPATAIIGATLLGLPAYVCAVGATPLVAVLLHKGLAPGAAFAFLLAGPAASASVYRTLRLRAGGPTSARYLVAVGLGSAGVGALVQATGWGATPPDLHALAGASVSPLQLGAAAILAALFARALVDQGPRGFLEPLMHPHAGEHEAGDEESPQPAHAGAAAPPAIP